MKILLVGEYSRLHNSLKEGLQALGHEVLILAQGDGFKNYPVDLKITHRYHSKWAQRWNLLWYKLTGIDLKARQVYQSACQLIEAIEDIDVVQLINESALKTTPELEIAFLKKLLPKTQRFFLLSCGIDYTCMQYMMAGRPKYSLMSAYLQNPDLAPTYQFQLQYLTPPYQKLHDFILKHCDGVIASDFDYHLPCLGTPKYLGLIPNPINTEQIAYIPTEVKAGEPLRIFHGVNLRAVHKKGNDYFEKALAIIQQKYPNQVEVETVSNLPYQEYIQKYNDCHILLDQVFGYDQGYNALEAMAKGKVVFSGAEQEWEAFFGKQEDEVLIHVIPEVAQIVQKLEKLIQQPQLIAEISKNARQFIETEHHYVDIAEKYVDTWQRERENREKKIEKR